MFCITHCASETESLLCMYPIRGNNRKAWGHTDHQFEFSFFFFFQFASENMNSWTHEHVLFLSLCQNDASAASLAVT